ncbi:MAG: hypothetical protein ABI880_13965 [Acidobacteriota bacterium]
MWTMRLSGALVVTAAVLSAGCYESDYPLDPEPLIDLNPAVLGVWRCLPLDADATEAPATLTVTRASRARVYDALWKDDGDTPDRYEAYASVLQGTTLMNVRERDERGSTGSWTFLRYTLMRPNVLQLQVVADAGMTGVAKTATAVRAAVERERNTPSFYTDVAVCARTKADQ